nr:GlcNAc-transferase family protein [Gloeothece verrucosa]
MRFAPRWDTLLIDMLAMCPSKKAILTAYPPGYEPPRTLLSNIPSRVVPANFDQSGVLVLMSEGDLTECSTPQLGAFIAAGFMFADASIIQQVPYDPEIYFYGEEVLFSARAWTRGWDIYHPHQAVCWNYYNSTEKQTRPVHWADHQNWWTFNGVSEQRFRINVDLHKQITPSYCPLGLKFETLWARLEPIDLMGTEVLNLSPEDLLLILCAQAAKDFMEYGEQLAQICDLAQLLHSHQNLDWKYIIKQAKLSGNWRLLLLYLFLANNVLGAPLPDEVSSYIKAEPIIKSLAVKVRERLLNKKQHLSSLLIDPIFYIQVRERLQDKLLYFLNYINPLYYLKGRKRIGIKLNCLIKLNYPKLSFLSGIKSIKDKFSSFSKAFSLE